jgi:hypothetical protein
MLASCNTSGNVTTLNSLSSKEIRNLEAVTTMNLLSESNVGIKSLSYNVDENSSPIISEETKTTIEKDILPRAEILVNNGINFESTITTLNDNALLKINEVSYKYIEKVSYTVIDEKVTYTFIYNEGKTTTETDKDEKETETSYHHHGLAYNGDLDVTTIDASTVFTNFVALSSNETEEGETKSKEVFMIGDDKTNYVKVVKKTEVENNETESKLDYKVFKDGITTLEYSLKIENEDNKTRVKIIKDGVNYKIRQNKQITNEYFVKVNEDDHNILVFTRNDDGTYSFSQLISDVDNKDNKQED